MNKVEFVDLDAIAIVARGLQELREKVVFVGGAVLGFYADAPATPEFRPTSDVDLTIELVGLSGWARLQERLLELGFMPDASEPVICRYLFQRITVDIMAAEENPFGPTNPWFKPGLPHVFLQKIAPELQIRLLPVALYFGYKICSFPGSWDRPLNQP